MFIHLVLHALGLTRWKCSAGAHTGDAKAFPWPLYIRGFCALVLFSYSQIATTSIRYLQCVDLGNGDSVVVSAPGIHCNTDEYQHWKGFAVFLLAVDVICVPIAMLVFLVINRQRIFSKDPEFLARWGLLFSTYDDKSFWWESAVLTRRTVAVVIDVVLWQALNWRATTFVLFTLLLLVSQILIAPFSTRIENNMETCSMIVLVTISAVITSEPNLNFSNGVEVALTVLLFVPSLAFMAFFIITRVTNIVRGRRIIGQTKDRQEEPGVAMEAVPLAVAEAHKPEAEVGAMETGASPAFPAAP